MINKGVLFVVAAMLFGGVGTHSLAHEPSRQKASTQQVVKQASASYIKHRDFASLKRIFRHLKRGMTRTDVERLLGEPDYSPGEGLFYYSSNRKASLAGEGAPPHMKAVLGIVVDYRDEQGVLTDRLQKYTLGPIGE